MSKTIIGAMPIRTVGLTPGHRWCGELRSVKPAVNNGKGARGLVQGLNSLNATYIRQGRIRDRPRKLAKDLRNGHLDVRFVIRPPASIALDKPRGLWNLVDVVTEDNLIRAIVTWMSPMPFPFAETVALTDLQRAQLESLVRAGSTPQALVFRCRLILRAADRDHPTNLQIAAEFDCNRHTVAGWRNRYLSNGLAGLQDAPRSGRPRRFSPLGEARSDQFGEQHNRTARLSRHPLVAG